MKIEIISHSGDLAREVREVWTFYLSVDAVGGRLFLDSYSSQTRESKRHNWKKQTNWDRLMKRDSNINTPIVPKDIEEDMRFQYQEYIKELPIHY